jgi:hypothetical protein
MYNVAAYTQLTVLVVFTGWLGMQMVSALAFSHANQLTQQVEQLLP